MNCLVYTILQHIPAADGFFPSRKKATWLCLGGGNVGNGSPGREFVTDLAGKSLSPWSYTSDIPSYSHAHQVCQLFLLQLFAHNTKQYHQGISEAANKISRSCHPGDFS